MESISNYFWNFVQELPALIAMLAGLIFALTRWKRSPKVSLIVAVSLGFLILHTIVFIIVYMVVPPMFLRRALTVSTEEFENTRRNVLLVIGFIYNSLMAVGFGLLLGAIFIQRRRLTPSDPLSHS